MATEWYFKKGPEQVGPVSSAELKSLAQSGVLTSASLVRKEGVEDWSLAGSIKGLISTNDVPIDEADVRHSNRLRYGVNVRDLRDVNIVEIGFTDVGF